MSGLPATPALAFGQEAGSGARRAHPIRLAHAGDLLTTLIYPQEANKLIVVPLFVATMIGESFFLGPLRLYTGSVWPASLGHATFNGIVPTLAAFTATSSPIVVYLPRRGRRDLDRGGSCNRRHSAGPQVPEPPCGRVWRLGTRSWTPSHGCTQGC
jgi:hypothetical protein